MYIGHYTDSDFEALLYFLNSNFRVDFINSTLLHEKLYADPDWKPGQALIAKNENREITGFMLGVVRDVRGTRYGYIKLMAVAKQYRQQGIARRMYQQLEEQFAARGVEVVRIYDVPKNYFMPGIDPRYTEAVCFARRLGFQKFGDTANLSVQLQENSWDTASKEKTLLKEGIAVARAGQKDYDEVMELVDTQWPLWHYEVANAWKDEPASLHIARLNGRVKAFSAHNANNKGIAWFGPMGTHADMRGKGIGSILLFRCLKDMQQRGYEKAIIPWVGPVEFYAHYANAFIDRVFWRYEKSLQSENNSKQ